MFHLYLLLFLVMCREVPKLLPVVDGFTSLRDICFHIWAF